MGMVAGLLAVAMMAPPAPAADAPPTSGATGKSALDRVLPDVKFDRVGLSDVFDFLRDVTGMNIAANWGRIEEAGIKRDTPVSTHLRNVKFSKILSVVLEEVSGPKAELAYVYQGGVITISTAEDLKKKTVLHTYDIHDLIAGKNSEVKSAALVKMISGSIAKSSWAENGGTPGTIKSLNGQLIVVQTPENQEAIENLLTNVRQLLKIDKAQ
jgi:hypothetical protein